MNDKSKGIYSALAVALLCAVALSPFALFSESDAANASASINIQPGQTWNWTPTFTSGLTPTVTVAGSETAMPADNAAFSASSGNVSVSSGKVIVKIPSNYSKSVYYVKVKAETTQPTQKVYYEITFNVGSYTLNYNYSTVNAKVGTAISDITPTISGGVAAKSFAISGTLPAGLTFNKTTGVISGTPTAYKAQTNYTVTATLNTTPVQTVSKTISIGAYTNISASNYTVYAIKGETAVTVPGVSMPTGTVLSAMNITATKDGTAATVTAGTAYNGMTVEASTGKITGTPNAIGKYVFTEKYTATAATGGSTATRTITIVVEDRVTISGSASFNSYAGHEDSVTLSKSAGPSGVAWSITEIKKNGTKITSGTDFASITLSNGVLKSSTATTAGTYTVTVKLATTNSTSTTSGATGTAASANYATKTVTITVAEKISITNTKPITFYKTEGKVYDSLTLTSNISGATFSVKSYGDGITSANISVSSDGKITPGTTGLTAGDYTIVVEAKDPKNATNTITETVTVHVVPNLAYSNTPEIGVLGE